MKKVYYFAYGSNLLTERLFRRVGKCNIVGTHKLHGYRLVFNIGGMYSAKMLFANIIPAGDNFVEGALYEITPEQLAELDRFEVFYHKEFFIAPDGNIAAVYVGNADNVVVGKPDLSYLNMIIAGCHEHDLNATFNDLINYKRTKYKLKKERVFSAKSYTS